MAREQSAIRADISDIDGQILPLLERRMQCSEVADKAKMFEKYSERVSFNVVKIFQAIMDESKRIQQDEVIKNSPKMEASSIDYQLLPLLDQRMQFSVEMAECKIAQGLPVFDPVREADILKEYSKRVKFNVVGIYQAIMDESKRIQQDEVDKKPLE